MGVLQRQALAGVEVIVRVLTGQDDRLRFCPQRMTVVPRGAFIVQRCALGNEKAKRHHRMPVVFQLGIDIGRFRILLNRHNLAAELAGKLSREQGWREQQQAEQR